MPHHRGHKTKKRSSQAEDEAQVYDYGYPDDGYAYQHEQDTAMDQGYDNSGQSYGPHGYGIGAGSPHDSQDPAAYPTYNDPRAAATSPQYSQDHDTQYHDTQYHDNQHQDTQYHDTQYHDTQYHDTQYHDTQYHGTQYGQFDTIVEQGSSVDAEDDANDAEDLTIRGIDPSSEFNRQRMHAFVQDLRDDMPTSHQSSADPETAKKHKKKRADKNIKKFVDDFDGKKRKKDDHSRHGKGGHGSKGTRA